MEANFSGTPSGMELRFTSIYHEGEFERIIPEVDSVAEAELRAIYAENQANMKKISETLLAERWASPFADMRF